MPLFEKERNQEPGGPFMKNNKNDNNKLNQVIDKLKLSQPVPDNIQKHIREVKKQEFIKTLKKAGGYSTCFGLISYVFFSTKKLGIGFSIIQTTIALSLGATIVIATVSSGIYYSVKYLSNPIIETIEKQLPEKTGINENSGQSILEDKKTINTITQKSAEKKAKTRNMIGIQQFNAENLDNNIATNITDTIAKNLSKKHKNGNVLNLRTDKNNTQVDKMLIGTVEQFENSYTINVRLVDVKKSKIIFFTSETVESKEEINSACKRISEIIAKKVK